MIIKGPYQTVVTKEDLRRLGENNPKVHGEGPFTDEDLEGHPMLGQYTIYIVEVFSTVTTDEMLKVLDENNLKSATVDHLVMFPRYKHPEVKFPIAVLQSPGSSGWTNPEGRLLCPVAEVTPDGRGLVIDGHPIDESWKGTNRFFALPK